MSFFGRFCFFLILFILNTHLAPLVKAQGITWSYSFDKQNNIRVNGFIPSARCGDSFYFEYGTDTLQLSSLTPYRHFTADSINIFLSEQVDRATLSEGTYSYRLVVETKDGVFRGAFKALEIFSESEPEVSTGSASFLGSIEEYRTPSITLNGYVNAKNSSTEYYFEYGVTSSYGLKTPSKSIAPRLNAFFIEKWDINPLKNWYSWGSLEHKYDESVNNGYAQATISDQIDWNHISLGGTGPISLVIYGFTGSRALEYPSFQLGGGSPDFRDARVSLTIRSNDFVSRGSELIFWLQSQPDTDKYDAAYVSSNWAYNSYSISSDIGPEWSTIDFTLVNDATKWKNSGTNFYSHKPWRYAYKSLDQALGKLNVDFFFNLLDINPLDLPTGSLDFDELTIRYRNYSLLSRENGGRLIYWPRRSDQDPYALTDGIKHGKGNYWHSEPNPTTPQDFIYELKDIAEIKKIQIHQNFEFPSKSVLVYSSMNGEDFVKIDSLALPLADYSADNTAYNLREYESPLVAKFIKFRIIDGYYDGFWGLGEIEVFGDGVSYTPGNEVNGVNFDIPDLQLGQIYHYRLVAENIHGRQYGADKTFVIPDNPISFVTTDTLEIENLSSALSIKAVWETNDSTSEPIRYKFLQGPSWIIADENWGTLFINSSAYNFRDSIVTVIAFDPKGRISKKSFYLKNRVKLFDKHNYYIYQDSVLALSNSKYPLGQWTGRGVERAGVFYPDTDSTGEFTISYSILQGGFLITEDIILHVKAHPEIIIDGNLCKGDTARLRVTHHFPSYLWSIGSDLDYIDVVESGTYSVIVSDSLYGTYAIKPVKITFVYKPETPSIRFCDFDKIESSIDGLEYAWFLNDTLLVSQPVNGLQITRPGSYAVSIKNINNCYSDQSNDFIIHEIPIRLFDKHNHYIYQDSVLALYNSKYPLGQWSGQGVERAGVFYPDTDSTGEFTITYSILQGGLLISEDIFIHIKPAPFIILEDNNICFGDTIKLRISEKFNSLLWSIGATTDEIFVTQSGLYSARVYDSLYGSYIVDSVAIDFKKNETPFIYLIESNIIGHNIKEVRSEWYLDDKLLQNQDDSVLTVLQTGVYKVRVMHIDSGCYSDFSEPLKFDEIITQLYENYDRVKIYPNPANDFVSIEINNLSNLNSVMILNSLGTPIVKNKITEKYFGSTTLFFNVKDWPPGSYFILFEDRKSVFFVKRFLIL